MCQELCYSTLEIISVYFCFELLSWQLLLELLIRTNQMSLPTDIIVLAKQDDRFAYTL